MEDGGWRYAPCPDDNQWSRQTSWHVASVGHCVVTRPPDMLPMLPRSIHSFTPAAGRAAHTDPPPILRPQCSVDIDTSEKMRLQLSF